MMLYKKTGAVALSLILLVATFVACTKDHDNRSVEPVDKVKLGRAIFFDRNLSNPIGQSCGTCHNPGTGFTDSLHGITSEGAQTGLFSHRNCPTVSYASFAPAFHYDDQDSVYIGGFFYDGRVNTLQEQAMKPFLNPVEMHNTDAAMVIGKLRSAAYFSLYEQTYGPITSTDAAFRNMADALAAFEQSREVSPFTSKFDYYLKGQASLTAAEQRGLQLFNDPLKGNCAACHISTPDADLGKVLFTDFTYDNIGVPRNPANPFYSVPSPFNPLGAAFADRGLGGIINDPAYDGHFKVPSLRNVARTAPYFHNGFFHTLDEVVHFYNVRDVATFPASEFPATVNHQEMGNLRLTAQEEQDIVAFLKTLSDDYR